MRKSSDKKLLGCVFAHFCYGVHLLYVFLASYDGRFGRIVGFLSCFAAK